MQDVYQPASGRAVCPRCRAVLGDVPTPLRDLRMAWLLFDCPACGQDWNEIRCRGAAGVTREWSAPGYSSLPTPTAPAPAATAR